MKYHPEEYNKRREEMKAALRKRCEVFSKLLEMNRVSSVSLDLTQTDDIVSLLDAGITVTGYTISTFFSITSPQVCVPDMHEMFVLCCFSFTLIQHFVVDFGSDTHSLVLMV